MDIPALVVVELDHQVPHLRKGDLKHAAARVDVLSIEQVAAANGYKIDVRDFEGRG